MESSADREKVIKGLEICTTRPCYCTDCPYKANCCLDSQEVMEDALVLLKEQEEVVRCKDCEFWNNDGIITICEKHIGNGYPGDWYCADGEREE